MPKPPVNSACRESVNVCQRASDSIKPRALSQNQIKPGYLTSLIRAGTLHPSAQHRPGCREERRGP